LPSVLGSSRPVSVNAECSGNFASEGTVADDAGMKIL
jgi:hypothetical protein